MSWLTDAVTSIDGEDLGFAGQQQQKKKNSGLTNFFQDFHDELSNYGFEVDNVKETDTKPIRCNVDGGKNKSGWYYFKTLNDAAFGSFGDWRDGSSHNWTSFSGSEIDQERMLEIKEQMEVIRHRNMLERKKMQKAAVSYVNSKIKTMKRFSTSPYMTKKQVAAIGSNTVIFQIGEGNNTSAIIPIYNRSGEMQNWQIIKPCGEKRFKKDAPIEGNFHIIGNPEGSATIAYCEGFATGASIHLALNIPVIVCFSASNMPKVAITTQKIARDKSVYFAADNDDHSVGEKYAKESMKEYPSSKMVIPTVKGYDFNDVWVEKKKGILKYFRDAGFEPPKKAKVEEVSKETVAKYKIWEKSAETSKIPPELMKTPSEKINLLADWMNSTAVKGTHQVAMIGALALACGVTGRAFCESEMGNFSSIMGCVIAPSGAGKDFVKKCINKILMASDMTKNLVGSSSYTSEAAIRNQLIQNPAKLSVIDEFGDKLGRALKSGGREGEAFEAFKEIYSDVRGTWAGRAYAMIDPSGGKVDMRSEPVHNPSLTLVGLSTPEQFVNAINEAHIEGGFLNRFIVVDATTDEVIRKRTINLSMPDWIVDHCETVISESRGGGLLAETLAGSYDHEANPKEVFVNKDSSDLFWEFACKIDEEYEDKKMMQNISSRWVENAMRLSVAIASFDNPKTPTITIEIASWCINFIKYHGIKLADLLDRHSHFDEHHKMRNKCLAVIRDLGEEGLSKTLMAKTMPFRGMQLQYRAKVLAELEELGYIVKDTKQNGASRPKIVYYAISS